MQYQREQLRRDHAFAMTGATTTTTDEGSDSATPRMRFFFSSQSISLSVQSNGAGRGDGSGGKEANGVIENRRYSKENKLYCKVGKRATVG